MHPDSMFFFLNYMVTCYFAVSAQVCQSQKSFLSTSFVAEFSFSSAETTFLVAFSLAETTFLVAETKFVKMWYRGEERCFKRRHSGRYNQMKCLLQIHLPTSLWLTSQIGIKMRGSCGSLQQCINTILQRFGNMIRCFFITTYLMFFEQLLKIENFQTKQQCFQHPMRGKWNFYSYETLNLIPQQNIWRQKIFFEISLCFTSTYYILHILYF